MSGIFILRKIKNTLILPSQYFYRYCRKRNSAEPDSATRDNYIQACLEFAAQLGQIADDTLEAVERRRILENEKRKELLEKGITVYGLSNFSVPAYIQYELTRFRLDFVAEKALIKRSYNYSMITSKDMISFWNEHRELFTRYQGDSFSYDEVAMVIRKRIREKEYEQEIQNILRKQH